MPRTISQKSRDGLARHGFNPAKIAGKVKRERDLRLKRERQN